MDETDFFGFRNRRPGTINQTKLPVAGRTIAVGNSAAARSHVTGEWGAAEKTSARKIKVETRKSADFTQGAAGDSTWVEPPIFSRCKKEGIKDC